MAELLNVKYKKDGNYDIYIEEDYSNLSSAIKSVTCDKKPKALIISDTNVAPIYLNKIIELIKYDFCEIHSFIINAGEESKNYNNAVKAWETLKENDFHRSDFAIALGGGVVGDLTGFIASTYMRGIFFVQIPTSLLAMADSSIGGKCAVDLDGYKNLVGSMYMPSLVYEAVECLNTLPAREFSCGMAEILKAGLIKNANFYEWLILNFDKINNKENDAILYMLKETDAVKQRVVENDPFEKGERMHLNFGHTIGHGIEKSSEYSFNHGESVALGMVCAAYISYKREMLSMEEFYEIRDMFVPFALPISVESLNIDEILDAVSHDKKKINGRLNFILLKKIGKAVTVSDVSDDEIKDSLNNLIVKWD